MSVRDDIINKLLEIEIDIKKNAEWNEKYVSITDYEDLVVDNIWTGAFQRAISENNYIYIPERNEKYYIDNTIIIPSDRHIYADRDAVICQAENTKVVMIRNENTVDGTHTMPKDLKRDCNISINGGRWEESYRKRLGYGKSGMYDETRSYYGVSTCMLFNNLNGLCLQNMTFAHTAGFSVQVGEANGGVFENIHFDDCYADGLHINGNTENIVIRNIDGNVGDDLVALNMYDWQDSSVNFGPMKNVFCDGLTLDREGRYKALRIQPGYYYFDDGSSVDCSAENIVIRNVKGIRTFKMYYQTPPYEIGEQPEKGAVGSGNNIFFENIDVDLSAPIDLLDEYVNSDTVRGAFAAFELGANIKNLYLSDINLTLYKDKYPMSYFLCIGPKSSREGKREIFDPYLSSHIDNIYLSDITINGENIKDISRYIKTIEFDNINSDNHSTAKGSYGNIEEV